MNRALPAGRHHLSKLDVRAIAARAKERCPDRPSPGCCHLLPEDARKQIAAIETELGISDLNLFYGPGASENLRYSAMKIGDACFERNDLRIAIFMQRGGQQAVFVCKDAPRL